MSENKQMPNSSTAFFPREQLQQFLAFLTYGSPSSPEEEAVA